MRRLEHEHEEAGGDEAQSAGRDFGKVPFFFASGHMRAAPDRFVPRHFAPSPDYRGVESNCTRGLHNKTPTSSEFTIATTLFSRVVLVFAVKLPFSHHSTIFRRVPFVLSPPRRHAAHHFLTRGTPSPWHQWPRNGPPPTSSPTHSSNGAT